MQTSQDHQDPALFFEQNSFGFIQKRIAPECERFRKMVETIDQEPQ